MHIVRWLFVVLEGHEIKKDFRGGTNNHHMVKSEIRIVQEENLRMKTFLPPLKKNNGHGTFLCWGLANGTYVSQTRLFLIAINDTHDTKTDRQIDRCKDRQVDGFR